MNKNKSLLNHIALTINDHKELDNFYKNILGFELVNTFELNEEFAQTIFGISKSISVYNIQKENLTIEIFVSPLILNQQYNHICLALANRDEVYQLASDEGYECIRIKRDVNDLIFIKDKNGSLFELKPA